MRGWIDASSMNESFDQNAEYIVLINGLGSTPESELYGVAGIYVRRTAPELKLAASWSVIIVHH